MYVLLSPLLFMGPSSKIKWLMTLRRGGSVGVENAQVAIQKTRLACQLLTLQVVKEPAESTSHPRAEPPHVSDGVCTVCLTGSWGALSKTR